MKHLFVVRLTPAALGAARERYGRGLAAAIRRRIDNGARAADLSPRHVGYGGVRTAKLALRLAPEHVERLGAIAEGCGLAPSTVLSRIIESCC